MTMTLPNVLAIAGSIALLIGLFGGGVKAKEIEVPKISIGTRIFSSLVGMALIGIAIKLPNPPLVPEPPTSMPVSATEPVLTPPQIIPTASAPTNGPTDAPSNTPTNAPSDTPSPIPEIIAFGSPGNPALLNPAFGWQPGNSSINAYSLTSQSNTLTLVTDGHTDQWDDLDTQPVIFYPITGNFETQVKVAFSPIWGHEFAALGVRSAQDHLTWLRLGTGGIPDQLIGLDVDIQGNAGKIRTSPYPNNTVYFKIERQGSAFNFYYGPDGINWNALQKDYVAAMPGSLEIFLTVGSWGDGGVSAEFSDFTVLRK